MARLKLTAENYHSVEANMEYMSASQFKAFRKCEAAGLAEAKGEWGSKDTEALRVGSYIDAHFSGEMDKFVSEHPDMFTKQGKLKSEYAKADKAIARLERDKLASMLLRGRHQVIKTGKIAGVWFKTKSDSLLSAAQVEAICKRFPEVRKLVPFGGGLIVDLKYMKDLEYIWDDTVREKVSWVDYWGYDYQGAIYQVIDKRLLPFVLVVVTKQDEPDIDAVYIPDIQLEQCMVEVEEYAPRYAAIKRGEIEPVACGKCAYCRSKKKLTGIKPYNRIIEEVW